jgi:hypothetical protein
MNQTHNFKYNDAKDPAIEAIFARSDSARRHAEEGAIKIRSAIGCYDRAWSLYNAALATLGSPAARRV